VPIGRHSVHVQHDAYVCPISNAYGNGGNAVLDVPAESHITYPHARTSPAPPRRGQPQLDAPTRMTDS
jgi:hypothetical protein